MGKKEKVRSMELRETAEEFLVEIQVRNYSSRTYKTYRNNILKFIRWCEEEKSITDSDEVKLSTFKMYAKHMLDKGNKGSYVNGTLKVLKSWTQFCWEEGFGFFDTTKKKFPWVKEDVPSFKTFDSRQVKAMLNATSGSDFISIRNKCMLTLMFSCGLRCHEVYGLKDEDIFLEDGFMVVHGKGRRKRHAAIDPLLKKEIMRYKRARKAYFEDKLCITDDAFFLSYTGKILTNAAIEAIFKKIGKAAGIEGVRCSPHSARHWFASQVLMQSNLSIYELSKLLGHSDLGTTSAYLRNIQSDQILEKARNHSVLMNMR